MTTLDVPRRRHWKAGLAVVGAALLLLPALAVLKVVMQPRSLIGRTTIGERTMPDGSLLVLEQVTTESPHQFNYDLPGSSAISTWLPGKPAQPNTTRMFSLSPFDGAMVLWMTRWDPATQMPMDLDWWQVSVLVDENGDEIDDTNPQRLVWDGSGISHMGADRPWKPYVGRVPPHVIVGTSELPMLRPSAVPRRLRIYDRTGSVVAQFELPPSKAPAPARWMPEALPAVKTADDVTVAFTGVSIKTRSISSLPEIELPRRRPRWAVVPEYTVTRNGHSAPEWKLEPIRLIDALGNIAWGTDCRLSVDEPAWKLQMTLARDGPTPFPPEEQFTFRPIALPGADSSQSLKEKGIVQGVELMLTAIGRGAWEYREELSPGQPMSHHADSRSLRQKSYSFLHSTYSSSGGPATSMVSIAGDLVHLVLELANLPPNHRDLLRVHDDQGRELPHRLERLKGNGFAKYFLFVDPPADAQSLRLTAFIHTARTFELFIAPPKP